MAFYTGQKVVCVYSGPLEPENKGVAFRPDEAIHEGQTYTIRRYFYKDDLPTVWLDEVARHPRACLYWGNDVGYAAERFRPAQEKKTDISVFTKLLESTKEPVYFDEVYFDEM